MRFAPLYPIFCLWNKNYDNEDDLIFGEQKLLTFVEEYNKKETTTAIDSETCKTTIKISKQNCDNKYAHLIVRE